MDAPDLEGGGRRVRPDSSRAVQVWVLEMSAMLLGSCARRLPESPARRSLETLVDLLCPDVRSGVLEVSVDCLRLRVKAMGQTSAEKAGEILRALGLYPDLGADAARMAAPESSDPVGRARGARQEPAERSTVDTVWCTRCGKIRPPNQMAAVACACGSRGWLRDEGLGRNCGQPGGGIRLPREDRAGDQPRAVQGRRSKPDRGPASFPADPREPRTPTAADAGGIPGTHGRPDRRGAQVPRREADRVDLLLLRCALATAAIGIRDARAWLEHRCGSGLGIPGERMEEEKAPPCAGL